MCVEAPIYILLPSIKFLSREPHPLPSGQLYTFFYRLPFNFVRTRDNFDK